MMRGTTAVTVAVAAGLVLAWRRGTPRGEAVRKRVVDTVRKNPGICKSDLARLTGLSLGSVNHHVRVLKRAGTLVVERHRRLVNVFLAGVPAAHIRWIGLLGRPDDPDLVDYLHEHPGRGVQSMSQHYNVSRKVIRRHLARLEEVGMVVRSEDYHPKFFLREGQEGLLPRPAAGMRSQPPAATAMGKPAPTDAARSDARPS